MPTRGSSAGAVTICRPRKLSSTGGGPSQGRGSRSSGQAVGSGLLRSEGETRFEVLSRSVMLLRPGYLSALAPGHGGTLFGNLSVRVILQRVSRASVAIGGRVTGAIERGFCLLVGVTHGDNQGAAGRLAEEGGGG